jgi:hypothetical protein
MKSGGGVVKQYACLVTWGAPDNSLLSVACCGCAGLIFLVGGPVWTGKTCFVMRGTQEM